MSYVQDFHLKTFKDHTLIVEADTPAVKIFRLKDPKYNRIQGCQIVFTSEGIVIMGDLTPCQNGVISSRGYGLNWFAGELEGSYLCEKFLTKEFRPDLAVRVLKEQLLYKRRMDGNAPPITGDRWCGQRSAWLSKEDARVAWTWTKSFEDNPNPWTFYEKYTEIFEDSPEGTYGYPLGDAGWLCVIQQTFARLYQEMRQEVPIAA